MNDFIVPYNEENLKQDAGINFGRPYQQCTISVMDTIADPNITFDKKGICNYYYEYQNVEKLMVFKGEEGKTKLNDIVIKIKASGKDKKYDCITGVSGGVDSTYLTLQAKKMGLRPLVVHFDNGWNSELAVKNLENIISKLGFDLYTLVVDWKEFRDLQLAYFSANVVDLEAITDHAIIATLYKLAHENNIKYILSGSNVETEAILPRYWIYNKSDGTNIRDIHSRFGKVPIKTYPILTPSKKLFYSKYKGIETICPLDYMLYNKKEVKKIITEELLWRDYGGKHYESIFTRFYQGYILPTKFSIDKRKAHLSNLIFSNQITKEDALNELKTPIYDFEQYKIDKEFVLKKLDFTESHFRQYLTENRIEHTNFKHEKGIIWEDIPLTKLFKPYWTILKQLLNRNVSK